MKIAIISIVSIAIAIFIAAFEKDNPIRALLKTKRQSKITAEEFVKKIESLGYFKYAPKQHLNRLKQDHLESFDPEGSWGGIWDDETGTPLDLRYYFCDGEEVFEEGGVTDMIETMQPTFKKIGFTCKIDHKEEEWDAKNESLNHSITVNGTNYMIFKNFKGYGWGQAVKRLTEILNAELEKQHITERIYLINGGNDGSLLLLDQALYSYFYEVFTDPKWKPLEVTEWAKVMGVK